MNRPVRIALISAAALGLGACSNDEVEEIAVDDSSEIDIARGQGYPSLIGALSSEQQANFDRMDPDVVSREYEDNRAAIISLGDATGPSTGSTGGAASGSSGEVEAASSQGEAAVSANPAARFVSPLPPRSELSFDWLDRNGDGQLSVAEYALWAVPTDPTVFVAADRTPFLMAEQINQAGQTFFQFDNDGSASLSRSEFQEARSSAQDPLIG